MAKVAILSDIHGNLPALQAVLKEVDKLDTDLIVFGGDIVGYGASPAECVEYVRNLGADSVFGNHESYLKLVAENGIDCLEPDWEENPVAAGVVHARRAMSDDALQWIFDLPWFLPIENETIIAHACLDAPGDWNYIDDNRSAEPTLEVMKKRKLTLGFFGHTHQTGVFPFREPSGRDDFYELENNPVTAVTVGSVGQPRDMKDCRSTWVLFDSDYRTIEFKRTEYDYQKAAEQILEAGLPEHSATRLLPN